VRGWPSEYLRTIFFFPVCCLFVVEAAVDIVGLAGWRGCGRGGWWSVLSCQRTCEPGRERSTTARIIPMVTLNSIANVIHTLHNKNSHLWIRVVNPLALRTP